MLIPWWLSRIRPKKKSIALSESFTTLAFFISMQNHDEGSKPMTKKVREPSQSSLREMFDRIRHVRYAVISPYYKLPMEVEGRLIILTDQFSTINNLWNLTRYSEDSQYKAALSSGKELIVTVLEKGKNVFPEMFESDILGHTTFHESDVKVPDSEVWSMVRLFWTLVYEEAFANKPYDRKVFLDMVFRRTGIPIRTRYRWLPWHAGVLIKAV
jgi:hypothetical protein